MYNTLHTQFSPLFAWIINSKYIGWVVSFARSNRKLKDKMTQRIKLTYALFRAFSVSMIAMIIQSMVLAIQYSRQQLVELFCKLYYRICTKLRERKKSSSPIIQIRTVFFICSRYHMQVIQNNGYTSLVCIILDNFSGSCLFSRIQTYVLPVCCFMICSSWIFV